MTIIYYKEGPQPLEYWREWKKSVRRQLANDRPWARFRRVRESFEGVATEPVNFPLFEDELVVFPRGIDIRALATLVNNPERRKPEYEKRLSALTSNFNAKGRGEYTFLILPQTFERILKQIEMRQATIMPEVRRLAIEYYFKGWRAHEVKSKVTIRTLTSYLQQAEEELDILGDQRGKLKLVTRTLDTSYTVLRYARETGIDFRKYFRDRIF